MLKKIFKFFWQMLGYLDKEDIVIEVNGFRKCLYEDKFGQRCRVCFILPWEVK